MSYKGCLEEFAFSDNTALCVFLLSVLLCFWFPFSGVSEKILHWILKLRAYRTFFFLTDCGPLVGNHWFISTIYIHFELSRSDQFISRKNRVKAFTDLSAQFPLARYTWHRTDFYLFFIFMNDLMLLATEASTTYPVGVAKNATNTAFCICDRHLSGICGVAE